MNRASIKQRAKEAFTGFYWPHVGIFAILSAIAGGASGLSSFSSSLSNLTTNGMNNLDIPMQFAPIFIAVAVIAGLIGTAYTIFVAGPIQVSGARIGLNAYRGEKPNFANLIWCVKEGRYMKCVGTMALVMLFSALACIVPMIAVGIVAAIVVAFAFAMAESSAAVTAGAIVFAVMLFIASMIPMIIVTLGLSQTPYIAAEEGVYGMEAIRKSWRIMDGHKGEYFVFGLSFIGWILLTMLSFGIVGIFWAGPYMNISHAGYYHELTAPKADSAQ